VGLVLFIALLNRQRDLAVLAFLVLGVFAGARAWSRLGLSSVHCDAAVDKAKVFPGEGLVLDVRAENAKFLPVWLQMVVPVEGALKSSTEQTTLTAACALLWHQGVSFRWELTALKRGVHRVGPPRMRVGDLLGFYPKERQEEETLSVVVYPKLVPIRPLSLPKREFFGMPGARSPVQDPVYLLGARDYQHNRPARYIHWKASARHNRLQEKVFEPSVQEKVLFLVDAHGFDGESGRESFERLLEATASLAVRMDRQGFALGLATNGLLTGRGSGVVPVARGPRQLPAVLEMLARLKPIASGEMTLVLNRGVNLPWGLTCVHFAREKGDQTRVLETFFRRRHIPAVFFVSQTDRGEAGENHSGSGTVYALDDLRVDGGKRS